MQIAFHVTQFLVDRHRNWREKNYTNLIWKFYSGFFIVLEEKSGHWKKFCLEPNAGFYLFQPSNEYQTKCFQSFSIAVFSFIDWM